LIIIQITGSLLLYSCVSSDKFYLNWFGNNEYLECPDYIVVIVVVLIFSEKAV